MKKSRFLYTGFTVFLLRVAQLKEDLETSLLRLPAEQASLDPSESDCTDLKAMVRHYCDQTSNLGTVKTYGSFFTNLPQNLIFAPSYSLQLFYERLSKISILKYCFLFKWELYISNN